MTAQLVVDSPGVHESLFGELLAELKLVGTAVPSRPPVPVMLGVVLEAHDGVLTAAATNFETTVRTVLPGRYGGPDTRVLVNHADLVKQLEAIGKSCKKTADRARLPVLLDLDALTVTTAGYTMPLEPLVLDDYPTLPEPPATVAHLDLAEFTALANRVGVALGKDDTLPMCTGLHTVVTDGQVRFEATDRFRFTQGTTGAITQANAKVLVPGKQLLDVLKALGAAGGVGQFALGVDDMALAVTCGQRSVSIRLLDSSFPKSEHLMPMEASSAIELLDRAEAIAALSTVKALAAAKGFSHATVTVDIVGGQVQFTPVLETPEQQAAVRTPVIAAELHGKIRCVLDPAFAGAKPVLMAKYKVDNVLAALGNFTGDRVVLHFREQYMKGTAITDAVDGLADPMSYRHLVMPIRVEEPAKDEADDTPSVQR